MAQVQGCEWHIIVYGCSDVEFHRVILALSTAILVVFGSICGYGFVLRMRMHLGYTSSPTLQQPDTTPTNSLPDLNGQNNSSSNENDDTAAHASSAPPALPSANSQPSGGPSSVAGPSMQKSASNWSVVGPGATPARSISWWNALSGVDYYLLFGAIYAPVRIIDLMLLYADAFPNFVAREAVWDLSYYFGFTCTWAVAFGVVEVAAKIHLTLKVPSRRNRQSVVSIEEKATSFFGKLFSFQARSETLRLFSTYWIALVVPVTVFPLSIAAGALRDQGALYVAEQLSTARFAMWAVHCAILCGAVNVYGFRLHRLIRETVASFKGQSGSGKSKLTDVNKKLRLFLLAINGTYIAFGSFAIIAAAARNQVYATPGASRTIHTLSDVVVQITNCLAASWVVWMLVNNNLSGFAAAGGSRSNTGSGSVSASTSVNDSSNAGAGIAGPPKGSALAIQSV